MSDAIEAINMSEFKMQYPLKTFNTINNYSTVNSIKQINSLTTTATGILEAEKY